MTLARVPRFVKPDLAGELRTGNGTLLCVWCGKPLQGRQQRWCGQPCVDEYKAAYDWQCIRAGVAERDNGICALCGIDTFELRRELERLRRPHGEYGVWWRALSERYAALEAAGWKHIRRMMDYGRDLWECDHIVPIADGGHRTDPANLRTLCVPCHRGVTVEQNRERARKRREATSPP